MLEYLFGSRTRVKLLRLFLLNDKKAYYVREIVRISKEHINSVRRELSHLEKMGLVTTFDKDKKKFYQVNRKQPLFPELKALLYKTRTVTEKDLIQDIQNLGNVHYLSLSGLFTADEAAPTDLFIVGKIHRSKLRTLLDTLQIGFDRDIYYTVLTLEEFNYRREITDKFVFDILGSKKIVVVDTIGLE